MGWLSVLDELDAVTDKLASLPVEGLTAPQGLDGKIGRAHV